MMNTTYFYNSLWEFYDSSYVSSSSIGKHYSIHHTPPQHDSDVVVKVEAAASSLYTAIACLACARPYFSGINQQNNRTDEEESSQTLSSKFVFPTPWCSTFKDLNFTELKTSTRNFRTSAALKGSLSSVYEWWVDELELTARKLAMGIAISDKVLNFEGIQDHTKSLDTNRLLVYEFTTRGSLENLFETRNEHPFRTDEEESRQKLSSKSVSPTCQCSTLKRFDFAELKTATANFFPEAVLDGNLDSVYKGWVDKHTLTASKFGMGMAVSVKVLNSKGFQDGEKWLEEVAYLGYLHHPNLVSLLGYCLEETTRRRLLVYEFPSRGSLEDLFDGPAPKVPWSLWLNVALDTAKGLAFLHSSKVVHGHFKPSNIFLDSNYNGKLFGFGLIKNSPTTFPIGVMETPTEDFGFSIGETTVYDAPEYLYTGQFSVESDVYCFGVVFLEILFGRRAFESFRPFSGRNLVKLIKSRPNLKPKFVNVVDSCTDCQLISGSKALELAIQCLSVEVKLRPTMDEVVEELGKLLNENKAGSNGSCC